MYPWLKLQSSHVNIHWAGIVYHCIYREANPEQWCAINAASNINCRECACAEDPRWLLEPGVSFCPELMAPAAENRAPRNKHPSLHRTPKQPGSPLACPESRSAETSGHNSGLRSAGGVYQNGRCSPAACSMHWWTDWAQASDCSSIAHIHPCRPT